MVRNVLSVATALLVIAVLVEIAAGDVVPRPARFAISVVGSIITSLWAYRVWRGRQSGGGR